jgi:hypothetical protein
MRQSGRRVVVGGLVLALLLAAGIGVYRPTPARALDLGDVLLAGGIVLVVSTFGSQINNFINSALSQREVELAGASKVVPIFSIGQGAYIGAAQVVGLPTNVRLVQGVAALNVTLGNIQGSALVPISTRRPGSSLSRVNGVGISAVIDFRL